MDKANQPMVENTVKRTRTGGVIHGMTVIFPDGWSTNFAGRIGKQAAIRQAESMRARERQRAMVQE